MEKKKIKSCVFKRDWKHYKTCYECGTLRKCTRKDKPKWYARIVEQLVVWHDRRCINRELRKKFAGISKKDARRIDDQIKKQSKH
jgi:hypothetical protein